MDFFCNGMFVASTDSSVKFAPEASFDTVYGEAWFLKKAPYDPATLFPRKNTLRVVPNIRLVAEYVTCAAVSGIDASIWLLYSKMEKPVINHTAELRLRDISRVAGYDILSLSVNYSLIYDVLEKDFSSGSIDFSEEDTLRDRLSEYRQHMNSSLLFDSPEVCGSFLEECNRYFAENCEKLVTPGWEQLSVSSVFTGMPVDDNLICKLARVDTEAFFARFEDSVNYESK